VIQGGAAKEAVPMALSDDLRKRVIEAVTVGKASCNTAAKWFSVSVSTVVRWVSRHAETGEVSPKPMGGDRRSGRVEAQGDYLKGLIRREPDITLLEISDRLAANCGERLSTSVLARFFDRHDMTWKSKTAHADEQRRADVLEQRLAWFDGQLDIEPPKLVFVDETGASTNMARKRGRCRRGRRLRVGIPHGHYKTITLVAALRLNGLAATKAYDCPINAELFEDWVEKCLVPVLSPGDIVVMDNLKSHKGARVGELITAAGAEVRYLPPYSPDMNPIEKAFSKLKAHLRKIAERTVAALTEALETCDGVFLSSQCQNYFKACGYDPAHEFSSV